MKKAIGEPPLEAMLIFTALFVVLSIFFALGTNLMPNCNFVACYFKNQINIIGEFALNWLLLPTTLTLFFTNNIWIILISLLISIFVYCFIISICIFSTYKSIRKKITFKSKKRKFSSIQMARFSAILCLFLTMLMGVFWGIGAFLFYPNSINPNLQANIVDYVIIATLEIGIIEMCAKDLRGTSIQLLRKLGYCTVLIAIMGAVFTTFGTATFMTNKIVNITTTNTSVANSTQLNELVNNATIYAFESGTFVAAITGLLSTLVFATMTLPEKSKRPRRRQFRKKRNIRRKKT